MATGKHLKIRAMGDNVLGVTLEGNPSRPEPIHFRVTFPGGDVDVVRTSDDRYWIHLRVDRDDDGDLPRPYRQMGRIVDARLDSTGKHASEMDPGDFTDPGLYHVALLVEKD